MTVASSVSKSGPYVGDGVQTEFPFAFRVLDASHLAVYLGEELLPESEYSVTLTDSGGTVVFAAAPVGQVVILRDVPLTQETDLQNNTAFFPEVLETGYDKLTMICQQLAEELSRCVKVSAGSVNPENYWDVLNGIKDSCITAMQSAASSAANAGVVALDVSHIWGLITGNPDLMNQALATAQELMEAKGAVEAAGEAARADINTASIAALEFAQGQIEQGKNAALDLLDETTESSVASISLAVSEAVGAQGALTIAKAAAETALANAIKTAQDSQTSIDAATLAAASSMSSSITAAQQIVAGAVSDAKDRCDQAAADAVSDAQAAAEAAKGEIDSATAEALKKIQSDNEAAAARYDEISAALESNLAAVTAAKNDAQTLLNSAQQVVESGKDTITATVDNGKTVITGSVSSGESTIATLVSNESLKLSTIVSDGSGTLAEVINQGKLSLTDMVNSGKSGIAAVIDTGNGEIALAIANGKTELAGLVSGDAGYIDQLNGIVSGGKTELTSAITGGTSSLNGLISSGTSALTEAAASHRVTLIDLVSGDGGLMAQLVDRVNDPTSGLKKILDDTKAVGVSGLNEIVVDGSASLQLKIASGEESITDTVNAGTTAITNAQNSALSAVGAHATAALSAAQNALAAQYAAEAARDAAAETNTEIANATVTTHNLSSAAHPALQELINKKAPLASPAFTGVPTVPTAAPGTNTTQIASTAFVAAAVSSVVSGGNADFGYPDYENRTEVSAATDYEASVNGWLFLYAAGSDTDIALNMSVTINGMEFTTHYRHYDYGGAGSAVMFPLKSGDHYRLDGTCESSSEFYFIPMR